jgi:hypothetical protein
MAISLALHFGVPRTLLSGEADAERIRVTSEMITAKERGECILSGRTKADYGETILKRA